MANGSTLTDEEFKKELATKMKVRFWLRIVIGIAIGVICQLYYGWKALLLAALVYGVIDGIGIFTQQVKIAKLKIKYKEVTEGPLPLQYRNELLGEGLGKGSVFGLYSVLLVFLTVGGIATITKLIISFLH